MVSFSGRSRISSSKISLIVTKIVHFSACYILYIFLILYKSYGMVVGLRDLKYQYIFNGYKNGQFTFYIIYFFLLSLLQVKEARLRLKMNNKTTFMKTDSWVNTTVETQNHSTMGPQIAQHLHSNSRLSNRCVNNTVTQLWLLSYSCVYVFVFLLWWQDAAGEPLHLRVAMARLRFSPQLPWWGGLDWTFWPISEFIEH